MFFRKAYTKNVNIITKNRKRNARNVGYVKELWNAKQNNAAKCGYWNVMRLCYAKQKEKKIYTCPRLRDKSVKIVTFSPS